jgi:hypothetical protein
MQSIEAVQPSNAAISRGECELLRPPCEATGRAAHHRHPPLPSQKRRPRRTHPAAGRQHLRLEIPALPPIQRGAKSAAGANHPRPGRREVMKNAATEPGGFKAISGWLSVATPPVTDESAPRIPKGCQQAWHHTARGRDRSALRSLRDRISSRHIIRWCRSFLAQPPAKGWHPLGMAEARVDQHLQKMGAVWK